jgi:hypothetical protein
MTPRGLFWKGAALLLGLGLVWLAWSIAVRHRPGPDPARFAEYYRLQISPLIDSAEARQQRDVDLSLTRLHEHFDGFRRGVPRFTEDITEWGTRFGIVGRAIKDLWTGFWSDKKKAVAVRAYTDEKFRVSVINEQSLQRALDDSLKTFGEATEAGHNRLEGEIRLTIGHPDSPLKIPVTAMDQYLKGASAAGRGMAARAGKDSVAIGTAGILGSVIAEEATRALGTAIIARLTAASVAGTAVAGSATAAGATAGGGGGSVAGPLGTIVGFGVGFAVGAIVDWWMSEKFKEKLSAQCMRFLDELERDLVNGTGGQPGLKALLTQAARDCSENYRKALFDELQRAAFQ